MYDKSALFTFPGAFFFGFTALKISQKERITKTSAVYIMSLYTPGASSDITKKPIIRNAAKISIMHAIIILNILPIFIISHAFPVSVESAIVSGIWNATSPDPDMSGFKNLSCISSEWPNKLVAENVYSPE